MKAETPRLRWQVQALLKAGIAFGSLLLLAGLFAGALGFGCDECLIRAGIAVMIATPVLRVALMSASFALAKEWRFCAFALGVLMLLGLSVLSSLRGGPGCCGPG